MVDTPRFQEEAERLAQKASEAARPSEKRMLETQAKFYEAIASEESAEEAPHRAEEDGV